MTREVGRFTGSTPALRSHVTRHGRPTPVLFRSASSRCRLLGDTLPSSGREPK